MTIRICNESDIEELVRVSIEAYNDHYIYLWYDGGKKYVAKSFNAETFANQLRDPNVALFLIFDSAEKSVGFLKLNIDKEYKTHSKADALEVERIYLTKAASGKGTGKAAMKFTDDFARAKNKKVIWLKAMDSAKSAVAFYKQCGYEIVDDYHLTFPEMKEEYRGMYVMTKLL